MVCIVLAMLVSALLPAAAEGADFVEPGTSPETAGTGPVSAAVGDFNNDGKRDQAVANFTSNDVTILLGNGAGDFPTVSTQGPVGPSPRAVAVADFDGDGNQDLAVPNAGGNNVSILLGDGAGNFTPTGSAPVVGGGPAYVAVGDFDRNGKQDLAVANSTTHNVTILLGDGAGGFPTTSTETVGTSPFWVAVGDFDGNGKQDLATANNGSNDVTILLGDGMGDFPTVSTEGAGNGAVSVAVGDFNRNGKQDLAVANFALGANSVSILLGAGTGDFTDGGAEGVGSSPREVTVGDFDRDGKQDLATANFGSHNVSILRGDGDGDFTVPATSPEPAGTGTFSVAVGDFDGDAMSDLAAANNGSNNVTVLINQTQSTATGDFLAAGTSPEAAGMGPFSVAVGDFNNDGKHDQAVANINSDDVSILLGNGDGNFAAAMGTSPELAGNGPISIAVGDFNRNGKQDLAVANQASNDITILLGNGNGDFTAGVTQPGGAGPSSVAVGDFNGDGKHDLAVSRAANVSILLGDGAGGFTAVGPEAAGTNPTDVAVGDFNGDGKQDLAVANYTSNDVSILLGDGAGDFTAAVGTSPELAGTNPTSVAVGDFNRDGRKDLAVANRTSNDVSILLGNGNGDFTPAVGTSPEPAGTTLASLAVGDFDANGKQDIAVVNQVSNNISILLGTGSGDFTAAGSSPEAAESAPVAVAVGDFDRNGGEDLGIANSGSDNVSILLDEADSDLDGVHDSTDACPNGAAMGTDSDGDGCKDAVEDSDDDNDGVANVSDSCPVGASLGTDSDGDGCKNMGEDSDDDNDTVPDTTETGCATTSGPGISTDSDSDNDGTLDAPDVFPCDPAESADADGDTLGNNADSCPTSAGPASNGGCPVLIPPILSPVPTATPAPRKTCRKGQKLKRGRCVKAKRKKK